MPKHVFSARFLVQSVCRQSANSVSPIPTAQNPPRITDLYGLHRELESFVFFCAILRAFSHVIAGYST